MHWVCSLIVSTDFAVGVALIDAVDHLESLFPAGLSEFFDISGERLCEHFRVKARELLEDLFEHELLGQGKGFDC